MKKAKKLKGMTLVECITALAVLAVFTTAVATAASSLSKIKITSNNVIKQTSFQAPTADNRDTAGSELKAENEEIIVKVSGVGTRTFYSNRYAVKVDDDPDEVASQQKSLYDGSERRFQFYDQIRKNPS
jgi:prepilin-type N-terminal cleavage/methylation domain-containing protein